MQKEQLLQEAVEFFRNEPGFKRLFTKFIKNYQSLGRLGGTAKLTKLTEKEKEALGGLLGKDFSKQSSATIAVQTFAQALEKTRFSDIDIKDLLFAYSGRQILTKSEEREEYIKGKDQFFFELMGEHANVYCQRWLEFIQTKGKGSRGIHSAYDTNSDLLKQQLTNVLKAIAKLPIREKGQPSQYWRLPVFADLVTKDPHAFDINTQQGRYLLFALSVIRAKEDKDYQISNIQNSEESTELLGYFGLIRDDILNFVTCSGIIAEQGKASQSVGWWQKSWEDGVVLSVPLREIVRAEKFYPANRQHKVFVVENSGVFSEILERFQSKPLPPLICTNGQFKLAALLLLDGLVSNGAIIYYSGDFDPEGLQMAQRLVTRYPDNVKLWHYTEEDYINCQSEVVLSSQRINKLTSINLPQLAGIKKCMEKNKKAGYQEQLIAKLVEDIEA